MEDKNVVATVNLGGWPHVQLTRKEFAELMLKDSIEGKLQKDCKPKLAFSMNGQALSLTATSKEFHDAMMFADYIQADGESLVKASRLLNKENPLPERIATTDFFHDAAKVAQDHDLRFFFLGASEEISLKAYEEATRLYPRLKIVGRRNGYFKPEEEAALCKEIVESGADVLWLGLGKPKEQLFCIRNLEKLQGLPWVKTCGGLFDFLAGRNKRAPQWVQDAGLEWAHRICGDPKRFLWRYLTTNIHAMWLLIRY